MENTEFKDWLEGQGAPSSMIEWVAERDYDLARCWSECHRGDWLLWWTKGLKIDGRILVKAAIECAALALPYIDDQRVHDCVEVTRRWCEGLATDEELIDAEKVAWRVITEASCDEAWLAANAVAHAKAATAVLVVVDTAAAAAIAARSAGEGDEAAEAAWEDMQRRTADAVRQYITIDMLVNPK